MKNYGIITCDLETHLRDMSEINFSRDWVESGRKLATFARTERVPITFFVDIAELYFAFSCFPTTLFLGLRELLGYIVSMGNSLQLHFHPQWLYRKRTNAGEFYDEVNIEIDIDEIRLKPFFDKLLWGKTLLDVYNPVKAYRAGGYKIQPISENMPILKRLGIEFDSSIRNTEYISPYEIWDGLYEVPIIETTTELGRWQFSSVNKPHFCNSIFKLLEITRGDSPKYFIMQGHTKEIIHYTYLSEMIKNTRKIRGFEYITFNDIEQVKKNG